VDCEADGEIESRSKNQDPRSKTWPSGKSALICLIREYLREILQQACLPEQQRRQVCENQLNQRKSARTSSICENFFNNLREIICKKKTASN
jgi:hypothetical protein